MTSSHHVNAYAGPQSWKFPHPNQPFLCASQSKLPLLLTSWEDHGHRANSCPSHLGSICSFNLLPLFVPSNQLSPFSEALKPKSKTSISQQIKSKFLATAHPRDVVGCQLHEPQLKPLKTLTKCTDFYGWKSRDCKGCRADQFWLDALWFSAIYPPLPICSVLRMTAWWLWVPALHLQKTVARGRHGD